MSSMPQALLTIVIPCYNAEAYINRCVASLEQLNSNDVLILFVNDGSTDNTQKMIENWISHHHFASSISKTNGGYCSAINAGLDNCKTEYVMFLGVDDEVIPNGINTICTHLRTNHPDILAFTTIKHYDDNDQNIQEEIDDITDYAYEGYLKMDAYSLYEHIGSNAWILFTRDTSRCYKMSTIGELRYFGKTGISSDGCFASLVACRASSFEFLKEKGYIWHLHKDSISGTARSKSIEKKTEEAGVWSEYFHYFQTEYKGNKIPSPVISHLLTYRILIRSIEKMDSAEIASIHWKKADAFSKWVCKGNRISFKARLKLMLQKPYILIKGF